MEREGARKGIAMCRNILSDRWMTYLCVMAITEWVHIAWNGCIGAIQALCNTDGGGVRFSRKSVTKV